MQCNEDGGSLSWSHNDKMTAESLPSGINKLQNKNAIDPIVAYCSQKSRTASAEHS